MRKICLSLIIFLIILGMLAMPILAIENNLNNQQIEEVPVEDIMDKNEGIININNGTVKNNAIGAIISTNNGVVEENNGRINTNNGTVTLNNDCIDCNYGIVNGGQVIINCGIVNGGTVGDNFGGILGENTTVQSNYYKVNIIGNVSIICSGDDAAGFNNQEWIKENGNAVILIKPEQGKRLVGNAIFTGEYDKVETEQPGLYYITNVKSDITIEVQTEDLKNYSIIEGNNQIWSGTGDLSFVCDGEYDKLMETFIIPTNPETNPFPIPEKNKDYVIEEGSTIITVKENYLKELVEGNYEIHLNYTDSNLVIANFKIEKQTQTGGGTLGEGGVGNSSDVSGNVITQQPQEQGQQQAQPPQQPATDVTSQKVSNNPQTGDDVTIFVTILVISTIGLAVTTKFKIKE